MLSNVLFMLLGSVLASIGFLTAAFADRVRKPHVSREDEPRQRPSRTQGATVIPIVETAEALRPTAPMRAPRAPRAESKVPASPSTRGGDDVVAALVAAGYKRPVATEATWACEATERTTVERWTVAALRRCALGGLS